MVCNKKKQANQRKVKASKKKQEQNKSFLEIVKEIECRYIEQKGKTKRRRKEE
jgi:hypothetical protein